VLLLISASQSLARVCLNASADCLVAFILQPKLKEGGSYIMESHSANSSGKTVIIFSPNEQHSAGSLAKVLKIFDVFSVDLLHIESRSSLRVPGEKQIIKRN
jgi:prephenate dehydratase